MLFSKSQSPQTGQVYFNEAIMKHNPDMTREEGHNPLKRVKFISMVPIEKVEPNGYKSQSPQTGQVYFNFGVDELEEFEVEECHNPLKRVKFISIRTSLNLLMRLMIMSQSPQTGQVYFNIVVYGNKEHPSWKVTIPSNGSSLFQYGSIKTIPAGIGRKGHNPLKRVKFISIAGLKNNWIIPKKVTIPSNGSSLFQ